MCIEHTTFRGHDRPSPSGLPFPKLKVLLINYLRCGETRNRIIRRTVDAVVGIAQLVLLYRKLRPSVRSVLKQFGIIHEEVPNVYIRLHEGNADDLIYIYIYI